jgi:hypothetical protein
MAAGFVLAAFILPVAASPARAETAQAAPPGRNVSQVTPVARLAALPDLAVTLTKVSVTCVQGSYLKAVIFATFRNASSTGTADLSKVPWQVIIKADWNATKGPGHLIEPDKKTIMPTANGPVLWKPGQNVIKTLTIHGIPKYQASAPKEWQYGFAVHVDPQNAIAEADEGNNAGIAYALDPCPH